MADNGKTTENLYSRTRRTSKVATRGRRAHIGNYRFKNIKYAKDKHQLPNVIGRKVPVDVLIADDHKDAADIIFGVCWNLIQHAETSQEAGALFASIIGGFVPELLNFMIEPLQKAGAKVTTLCVPSESEGAGYHFDLEDSYTYVDIVIFIGVSLMLPFKHISENNYANFIKARMKGLGGRLGVDDEDLTKLRYPLDFTRAKMVRETFAGNMELKQEILTYLMWAGGHASGCLNGMARYVSMILAWNELDSIVCIWKVLVCSESPVLEHASVQDEVDNVSKALCHIERSSCPQYFRYFCTKEEEQLIQRHKFRTLGAVAQELFNKRQEQLNKKPENRYIDNFTGTSSRWRALVQELVEIHLKFCDESMNEVHV